MRNKYSILVVEDNVEMLKFINDILSVEGYNVRPANSGELAFISAAKTLPDLILLDINLPDINGLDLFKKLNKNEITKNIPIIFVTCLSDANSRIDGLKLGAVDYITKPFHPQELILRLKNHFSLKENYFLEQQNIDLKKQNEEILKREIQLKKAQEIAKLGSWSYHKNTKVLEWSDEMYNIFDVEKDKYKADISYILNIRIHPEDLYMVQNC